MKWSLYRNFPSLILDPSIDRKIRTPTNDNDPRDQDEKDFALEHENGVLRSDNSQGYHEDLSRELHGILRNMKDHSQSYIDHILNLRLT